MAINIKAIMFCEFHPIAGPKIVYQVPEDFISKESFDCIAVYIITKPELQSKVITVNAFGDKFIGYPVCITNAKYSRNALLFNVCFVLDESAEVQAFQPVVKKLAAYLTSLELENGFISEEDSKKRIPAILTTILHGLNEERKCIIPINAVTTIYLHLSMTKDDQPEVFNHHVPIFLWDSSIITAAQWDITTQQILPYIDGFQHIKKIAAQADVDINLVRLCIQNMVHFQVVTLISIFQYSNVYIPTPKINNLFQDKQLQEECTNYVARKFRRPPLFRDVFQLYSGLSAGATVRDLCSRYNPAFLRIDERCLIQFGLMKGFIRRLHKFPVLLKPDDGMQASQNERLARWLNGSHNYDEICTETGMSHQKLDEIIENHPNITVIWK
ncbi:GATOR complex protein NPRL2-like [Xenia sp. Carnegie-2017]|uniref:GATOR complex protein NPRL2-like n=1 Tax=Xenia sp. Carnegie-2017 TaxID=2897299 RepID=UPI001F04CA1F|nr:GATOR complex protein NPRL2-like [Xenia sp. Carnegie-2017]